MSGKLTLPSPGPGSLPDFHTPSHRSLHCLPHRHPRGGKRNSVDSKLPNSGDPAVPDEENHSHTQCSYTP
ncbi:hypothetical protein GDO81_010881 [Engystomops pustulosus]|uniref:Uncharacterized protein n=1 Tax=Engystomops pustulosus TaxID=76066 RepID=A0AAV7BAP3_ENGPU|nr:hypothetical protein GDO81_014503 [Engystomops pustulosus]KAG8579427.1 hypothetical protein GDO81_010881 [Engystomops pustulosus]